MGDIQTQMRLVLKLEEYASAERASQIVGDKVPGQWRKADRLHAELLSLALACGYEPGGLHRHMDTVEWTTRRRAWLIDGCPNHLAEKRRAA